jgi:mono/diheme cytochrome c family protein
MCHAVGQVGDSPNGGAPPFRRVALRYNSISLEQALNRIALKGHYEMRPQNLSASEAEDVAAYIQTLEASGR